MIGFTFCCVCAYFFLPHFVLVSLLFLCLLPFELPEICMITYYLLCWLISYHSFCLCLWLLSIHFLLFPNIHFHLSLVYFQVVSYDLNLKQTIKWIFAFLLSWTLRYFYTFTFTYVKNITIHCYYFLVNNRLFLK